MKYGVDELLVDLSGLPGIKQGIVEIGSPVVKAETKPSSGAETTCPPQVWNSLSAGKKPSSALRSLMGQTQQRR